MELSQLPGERAMTVAFHPPSFFAIPAASHMGWGYFAAVVDNLMRMGAHISSSSGLLGTQPPYFQTR